MFLFDCNCGETAPVTISSTSSSKSYQLVFKTNTMIGSSNDYSIITNFDNYRYYTRTNITYYITYYQSSTSATKLASNFVINWITTNYYDTNLFSSFNLHEDNENGVGITVYSNKFYITDNNDNKVYIYSNTGDYLSDFNLNNLNTSSRGITAYSNAFYVIDGLDKKVYIYNNTGNLRVLLV